MYLESAGGKTSRVSSVVNSAHTLPRHLYGIVCLLSRAMPRIALLAVSGSQGARRGPATRAFAPPVRRGKEIYCQTRRPRARAGRGSPRYVHISEYGTASPISTIRKAVHRLPCIDQPPTDCPFSGTAGKKKGRRFRQPFMSHTIWRLRQRSGAYASRAFLAISARPLKDSMSSTAICARTLRSSSMPASLRPCMN